MEETVIAAKENLKNSFTELGKNLKIYATAKIDLEKSRLKTVGTSMLGKVKDVNTSISKALNNGKKSILKFKENVSQKATAAKAVIGSAKNVAIKKVKESLGNFGQKATNVLIKSGTIALEGAAVAVSAVNGIINFTSEQIAKYRANRAERIRQKQELIAQKQREQAARIAEAAEREKQHQNAVESAEAFKEYFREQRKEAVLNFKKGAIQKAKSAMALMKIVGKKLLNSLNPRNIDLKIANAFANSQIFVTSLFNNAIKGINDRIDFLSEQLAQYRADKFEKERVKKEKIEAYKEELARKKAEKAKEKESHKNAKQSARVLSAEMRKQDMLNLKASVVQNTKSALSKVGSMGNNIVQAIKNKKDALDEKVSTAFKEARVKTAGYIVGGVLIYNNVKNYASEQIKSFREWNSKRKEQAAIEKAAERERLQKEHDELIEKLRIERDKLIEEITKNIKQDPVVAPVRSM